MTHASDFTPSRYEYDATLRTYYRKGVYAARFRNGAVLIFDDYDERKAFYDGLIDGGMFEAALEIDRKIALKAGAAPKRVKGAK